MTGDLTAPSLVLTGNATIDGNIVLPYTTASAGLIRQGGSTFIHAYGNSNFFAGVSAGNLTMTGTGNTGVGTVALYSNTTGTYNTAMGYASLNHNTDGFYNTATGDYTLMLNTVGHDNTASGISALYSNGTGSFNSAFGSETLLFNTSGYGNTAIGSSALKGNNTGIYNTASGYQALYSNTTGTYNTASGYQALYSNTTGFNNTAIGMYALYSNTTGSYNTGIGYNAGPGSSNLTNTTAIGSGAYASVSNWVRIGNNFVTHIGGQVAFSNDSDVREKKDIADIGYGMNFIRQLRPVQYRLKDGNDRIDFGFIAQDVELTLGTDYNILGISGDKDRMLSLRYTDFIAPMVKAMQEQQSIIDDLKARIEKLEALLAGRP
jgi:hypothetical protein